MFYKARTLPVGGHFDVEALRGLVLDAYADYTLPLFDQEVADAEAARLLQVSFSGIGVSVLAWFPWNPEGTLGAAEVSVTRTRMELRSSSAPAQETATYKFRVTRMLAEPDGVAWVVHDFVNPATDQWISVPRPVGAAQAATELKAFFDEFYLSRAVEPGQPPRSACCFAGSYAAYTVPLLEQTERDVASGAIKEIRYGDISVKLLGWDATATGHGGLALVEVSRTAYVTKARGPDAPQTATYRFRVHRHEGFWLAVDFFRQDVNRWVTDLAGATVIVPEGGHG